MPSQSVRTNRRARRRLRHPAEVPFFIFMVVLNLIIIAAILDAAWVLPFLPDRLKDSGWAIAAIRTALISLPLFPALIVVRETQRASIRGTAVQLSPQQFPDLYRTAEDFARTLGLRRRPELFLANGNGALNAFAAQATGYDYVVLSNELFANLHNSNRDGLRFILGHELGHIRLHHVSLWYQLAVACTQLIPLLGPALSWLREYSCDRHGAYRRRSAPQGWSCWPPAGTRKPTLTSTSSCGRAAGCAGSGSAWRSWCGRTCSRFAAWSVCTAWASSAPMSKMPGCESEDCASMTDDTVISYQAAVPGTPVLSSTGTQIGTLEHVLEVPELDVFDGIVIATNAGLRFIDADYVQRITRSHIWCRIADSELDQLPRPGGPPVYRVDALADSGQSMHDILGRLFRRPHWIREHNERSRSPNDR